MTTYGGRSAQYVPGRDVPNKEPPVSKFVVEKLYRVHRLRMKKIEPLVDCHVHIPDFLTNTTWKKNAENSRKAKIMTQNLHMYHRITKLANEESVFKKETKLHVRRIENKAGYLKKLKEQDRLHKSYKIQKENEYILKRIEKAQPEYTKKKLDEWYRHHELFKAGRRSDPTAGHIMTGMGNLLPPKLPPLSASTGSFAQNSHSLSGSAYSPSRTAPGDLDAMRPRQLHNHSLQSNSLLTSSMVDGQQRVGMPGQYGDGYEGSDSNMLQQSVTDGSLVTMHDGSGGAQGGYHNAPGQYAHSPAGRTGGHHHKDSPSNKSKSSNKAKSPTMIPFSGAQGGEKGGKSHSYGQGAHGGHGSSHHHHHQHSRSGSPAQGGVLSHMNSARSLNDEGAIDSAVNSPRADSIAAFCEDLTLLLSRPFALPHESKNCLVQVYISNTYDENIYLKVITSGISPQVLCERPLQIDKAYEVVNAGGNSSHLIHGSDNEDLGTLSALLIKMFQEADDDGSGSLTFDEFQTLMEQVELGISPQELRFVISEADENENGVVDYEEFVPLAVDLIQSFRARNRAKTIYSQRDVEVDELIMKAISTKELEKIANFCLEKIYEIDTKKYGLIRVPELKRCLNNIASMAGLKDSEISMICQMLPRDQFERCKYNTAPNNFLEVLSKVRFMTMKNAMIEQQGSGLQKYLLDLCREEEARIASDGQGKVMRDSAVTGKIPFRALINILSNSSRLSLSRLQVLVIMSEAHVQEGMINYFQFVPVVAKAIEIMFEPKALRQRAELIEKTDLSPEALLQGMHSDMFEQRLMTLFKSYDIDKSGNLDQNEFIACLESLDLQLSYAEMVALMASADVDHTGALSFPDFMGFFTHNLLNLEKERHVRLMQSSMTNQQAHTPMLDPDSTTFGSSVLGSEVSAAEQNEFIDHLTNIFKLSDTTSSGKIPFEEFENVLKTFNVTASKYLMDVMLGELHVDEEGMVDYSEAVSSCGELLKVYRAKESAHDEHIQKEEWANEKADEIVQSHEADILHIVNFLKNKIKRINESVVDPNMKFNEMANLFRSSASGLSRFEANRLINRLLSVNPPSTTATPVEDDMTAMSTTSSTAANTAMNGGASGQGMGSKSNSHGNHSNLAKAAMSPAHRVLISGLSISGKQFRSHFTSSELHDAVYEARKISVMRGLMEEIDGSATRATIQKALHAEAARLRQQGSLSDDSNFIPVKSCFKVLESLHELRLNRSQILFVISWADCFDKDGTDLDIDKFAEHASSIVAKLTGKEMMETRADVVNQGSFDEKKVLNGMRENELEMHIEYALASLNAENDMITPEQLYNVLKQIPRLNLSDRDCTALTVPFDHAHIEEGVFNWKDHLHSIVSMVITHCRERIIHRRMSLHVTSSTRDFGDRAMSTTAIALHEEAKSQLKQLADKLLNFVKIQMVAESIVIHLPIDNEKRRQSQLGGFADEFSSTQSFTPNVLYQGVRWIEWKIMKAIVVPVPRQSLARSSISVQRTAEHRLSSGNIQPLSGSMASMTMSPSHMAMATKEVHYEVVKTKKVPVLVSIVPGENGPVQSTTSLACRIITSDAQIRLQCPLPVKMPSIGLVDREAARQFAGNVVDKMYVQEVMGEQSELKMREE